uniref:SusC/RagA family TonB-linked outer membrane protein n=1 Tax=Flavobacterium sp. TaxID=239 RepID=UPI00404B6900
MKTIYKKLLLLLVFLPAFVMAQNVSGVVTDEANGQPLPGVNVIVKGTTNGVSTDFDGKFNLSNVADGSVIEFSFIGYKTQDVAFKGQKQINLALAEDTELLDEVVLVSVGYGTVKKKDATGAVTSISAKDFNQGVVATPESLLNGRVAGVTINSGGGAPGSGAQIRIRGGSSLLASSDPLIVLDGLPLDNSNGAGSTSVLASINPNDIESFSVLKDASATAIFGSRASNGVIIINTKRAGKTLQVDYNFQYGSGTKMNKIDVFGADAYRDYVSQVRPDLADRLGTANTDWQEEIYRRTDFVDNNVSIRGNLFKAIPTRLSFGNTYQEGLRLTNNFNRSTVSVNMSPVLFGDHLKVRLAANYTNQKNRFADGVEGTAIAFDPTQPVYDAESPYDGFFEYRSGANIGDFLNQVARNPVAQLLQTNDTGVSNRIFGNVNLDYKFHFLPELRAVVNLGLDHDKGERRRLVGNTALTGFINGTTLFGTDEYSETTRTNSSVDFYLNYVKEMDKLKLDLTTGYSYQKFESEGFNTFNIRNAQAPDPRAFIITDVNLVGFFARSIFTYNDKYILTLNYRRDGTSRFGSDNRWGNFPSAAFAWKLKEDFFIDNAKMSELKLRLGWGVTGQQAIPNETFYLQTVNLGDPNSQYIIGGNPIQVGVPSKFGPVKWEETTTYNAGIDYGFFDDRLNGSADLYYKKSTDLFQNAPFADGSNFGNQGPQNIGSMSVLGAEFSVNYDVIRKDDMNWNVSFNYTRFVREIDELALGIPIEYQGVGAGTGGTTMVFAEGYNPGSFYVYKQLYDAAGAPIEGAYADINGDGVINGDDRYVYRNSDPDFLLGFATSFKYKNFDISTNVRVSVGNHVFNATSANRSFTNLLQQGASLQNISTDVLSTDFEVQNLENILSDRNVENASFLRVDYITAGYTFPKWLDGKASLRLFTSVQNPILITKYKGLDPEINGGVDNTIYPRQRQILVGANVKF